MVLLAGGCGRDKLGDYEAFLNHAKAFGLCLQDRGAVASARELPNEIYDWEQCGLWPMQCCWAQCKAAAVILSEK